MASKLNIIYVICNYCVTKIWTYKTFLIKLYFKATKNGILKERQDAVFVFISNPVRELH